MEVADVFAVAEAELEALLLDEASEEELAFTALPVIAFAETPVLFWQLAL